MYFIDNATALSSGTVLVPPPVGPNPGGHFTSGTPGATPPVPPTIVDAYWLEMLQQEQGNIVTASGITMSKGANNQALTAIRRFAGANISVIIASTTLNPDNAGPIFVSAAAGNVVLTLPAAASVAELPIRYQIFRTDSSSNTVTYVTSGSDTLQPDGTDSATLAVGADIDLVGDGASAWWVRSTIKNINVKTYTASGTYTRSEGLLFAIFDATGGGGGGGAVPALASGVSSAAGAGGQGGHVVGKFTAEQIGSSLPITIGTGGSGGAAGSNNGTNGGTTSVGTLLSAGGGAYGNAGIASNSGTATTAASGLAGSATGGNIPCFWGTVSFPGQALYGNAVLFASNTVGGTSAYGVPGGGEGNNNNASSGTLGSGGGGAAAIGATATGYAGGDGGGGIVVIVEYLK